MFVNQIQFMKVFIVAISAFILSVSPAKKQETFDAFCKDFVAGYNELHLPQLELSYVSGLEHIGTAADVIVISEAYMFVVSLVAEDRLRTKDRRSREPVRWIGRSAHGRPHGCRSRAGWHDQQIDALTGLGCGDRCQSIAACRDGLSWVRGRRRGVAVRGTRRLRPVHDAPRPHVIGQLWLPEALRPFGEWPLGSFDRHTAAGVVWSSPCLHHRRGAG